MATLFAPGLAGGLADGISSGMQLAGQIQSRQQQEEVLKLRTEAQKDAQEFQIRQQKIQLDALKFKRDQVKKREELQERLFQSLQGGSGQEPRLAEQVAGPGAPTALPSQEARASLPPQGAQGGAMAPQQFFQLQQLAARSGMTDQFNQAIKQGFIQTPTSVEERAQEGIDTSLERQKTRAQIAKFQADTERAGRPPMPTQTTLALEATGGDPVAAMALLKPERAGLSVEFEDGNLKSVSTAKSSDRLVRDSIAGIQGLTQQEQPISALKSLLESNPTSPTAQGQMRVLSATMQAQAAAFKLSGPKGKEIQTRIANSKDVSEFEFLSEMAAFSIAAINNPGGRISDADVNSARKALGLGTGIFARPKSAELILPRLDAALTLLNQKKQAHQQTIQLLQQGRIQTDTPPPRRTQSRETTSDALSRTRIRDMKTDDLRRELERLKGG